jgi:hypothetical protein
MKFLIIIIFFLLYMILLLSNFGFISGGCCFFLKKTKVGDKEYSQNESPWVKLDLLGQFSF